MSAAKPQPRMSQTFYKCARDKNVGDDLLPSARAITNHVGKRGVSENTFRAWVAAEWADVVLGLATRAKTDRLGRVHPVKQKVVGVFLTKKGHDAVRSYEKKRGIG